MSGPGAWSPAAGAGTRLWRVFYTAPNAELKIETTLTRSGLTAFVPKMQETRQWTDRKKKVTVPILRGYLFANVHEKERLQVLESSGIVRCVAFAGTFVEVTPDEISRLELLEKGGIPVQPLEVRLPVGEQVLVTDGPLKGLVGDIVDYRGSNRLVIRLDSIRQALSVQVPSNWVHPTKKAA